MGVPVLARENNPRLVSRQTWWIQYAQWSIGNLPGPICTECADSMPDAPFVGALVCENCAPYVPESERSL